jgi:hypothetical protein
MNLQPGTGYGFSAGAFGATLNVGEPFGEDSFRVSDHPFRVFSAGSATVGGSPEYYFYCTPGTINNLDPLMSDVGGTAKKMTDTPRPKAKWDFNSTTHYSYVYLDVGVRSTDPLVYPETDDTNVRYPLVGATDIQVASDNDFGKIVLAAAYKDPTTSAITIWQYVTGSLWSDRIKMAGIDARYFFART